MISEQDKSTIIDIARRYDVRGVLLFGSNADPNIEANDIDLAVEGLVPEKFFDFYGRLFFELPKPVDLVDLEQETPIAAVIRTRGVRIYER